MHQFDEYFLKSVRNNNFQVFSPNYRGKNYKPAPVFRFLSLWVMYKAFSCLDLHKALSVAISNRMEHQCFRNEHTCS